MKNRYFRRSKLTESKFRQILRLFALDLTASDTARLSGVSVRSVNDVYLRLRERIAYECERRRLFKGGQAEVDESYFGPPRMRCKRGRGAGGKTSVFGIFKRNGRVYTEIVPDCSKPTLLGVIRGKIKPNVVVHSDGWRGYGAVPARAATARTSSAAVLDAWRRVPNKRFKAAFDAGVRRGAQRNRRRHRLRQLRGSCGTELELYKLLQAYAVETAHIGAHQTPGGSVVQTKSF